MIFKYLIPWPIDTMKQKPVNNLTKPFRIDRPRSRHNVVFSSLTQKQYQPWLTGTIRSPFGEKTLKN